LDFEKELDNLRVKVADVQTSVRVAKTETHDQIQERIGEAQVKLDKEAKAAATIHGRLVALMPQSVATPEALLALTDEQMRQAGLSRQKCSYLRDLATKVVAGELPIHSLHEMTDDEVIEAIVKVKGLGRWSAEMFLMFRLHRPDVLPVGDLGIKHAFRRAYGLDEIPSKDAMIELAEPWRPYRTRGSEYLWRSLATSPI